MLAGCRGKPMVRRDPPTIFYAPRHKPHSTKSPRRASGSSRSDVSWFESRSTSSASPDRGGLPGDIGVDADNARNDLKGSAESSLPLTSIPCWSVLQRQQPISSASPVDGGLDREGGSGSSTEHRRCLFPRHRGPRVASLKAFYVEHGQRVAPDVRFAPPSGGEGIGPPQTSAWRRIESDLLQDPGGGGGPIALGELGERSLSRTIGRPPTPGRTPAFWSPTFQGFSANRGAVQVIRSGGSHSKV